MAVADYVDSDIDLLNRLKQLYTKARQNKRNFYDSWQRNYRLLNNRVGSNPNISWAPQPRLSRVWPVCSTIVSWMTDQQLTVEVNPAAEQGTPYSQFLSGLSQDLETILRTNWRVLDYNAEVKKVIWDALQTSIGILKVTWDQYIDGGSGNAVIKRVDPWTIYVDPKATSFQDAEYVIEVRVMSLDEIERRWPGSSVAVEAGESLGDVDESPTLADPAGGGRAPMTNPGSLNNQPTRWSMPTGRGPRAPLTPSVVVYEYWLKENEEDYEDYDDDETGPDLAEKHVEDRWRVVVATSNVVLMDEYADELWPGGWLPYERYLFEDIGEFYGIALMDHLAHPALYINRLLTAIQQNAELAGNPIFMESTQAGLDRTPIVNKPGQRLKVTGAGAMQNSPKWLDPPNMPGYMMDLLQFWIQQIEDISGISAAMKGANSPNRASDATMNTIQEAAFVRIRSALSNLEMTLNRCAYKLADLIADNFNDDRVMAVVGKQGERTSLILSARQFQTENMDGAPPFKYTITIEAGSSMPTSRQARINEADKLFAMGGIDRPALLETHQFPNWQIVNQRIDQGIAAGTFQPPGARKRSQRSS